MRILITGGAGFIGSHLVDALVEAGEDVVVVDNLASGRSNQVNPRARFYDMDICDQKLKEVFEKERPEVVFHLAAQTTVSRSVADPVHDNRVNVAGSLNVIANSASAGVRKIVYASSSACYGTPAYLPVDEDHPARPLSPYGVSKHSVEHYLEIYDDLYGLSYTALRFANVYGPRQNPHGEGGVVAIFAGKMLSGQHPVIYGNGCKTRDYVYVSDVVAANLAAMRYEPSDVFNIGTGRETTDNEVYALLSQACGYRDARAYAPERPGDIPHMFLDNAKACRELKWSPSFSLEAGIGLAVAYYRNIAGQATGHVSATS
jgi:UDP-glucose 4-epimerase